MTEVCGQIPLGDERIVLTNERRVNSDELEYSPVFYKDGIVFISTRHESLLYEVKDKNAGGINIMSIYWSQRDEEGFLQAPEVFSNELLTRMHEGPLTFDPTASTIYFTRNELVELAPDNLKKLQVYQAEKDSNEIWGNIQKLPFNNKDFNFLHPTVSANGDMMVIASDVPGGYGGMDLYLVKKTGNTWSQMVNLGPTINTPGNDVFPYLGADGALYFSSDGHGGYGNLDLFFTVLNKANQKWSTPVNLESPFNTSSDDFGFIVDRDNKNGYFSSDRKGGFGSDDIYGFYIEGNSQQPFASNRNLDSLVIKDASGNPMEGVTISAINFDEISLSSGDKQLVNLLPGDGGKDNFILDVNSGEMGQSANTGTDGKADLDLRRGGNVIKIAKDGYLPEYVVVTPETDLSKLDIKLRKAANCVALNGEVLYQSNQNFVSGAEIHIVDVESNEAIVIYSDRLGKFDYCLSCNRTFSIYAVRNGANSAPGIVSTKEIPCTPGEKINLTLYLGGATLYAGMTIQLPNIYFNFDDASLRPDAYRDLDEVVGMMNNYPGMKLELASHTDARGSTAYNLDLSKRRSASVLKYLTSKGVDGGRLVPWGYGEGQIRNRCTNGVACTEREHQYNRRTEVKILELNAPEEMDVMPIADNGGVGESTEESSPGEPDAGKGGEELVTPEALPVRAADDFGNSGSFAVIAGTFANQDFAVRRSNLLNGLGYTETSIVKQSRNGLYAVLVNSFDTKTSAFGLVKKLANQQLSAYVLKL